MGGRSELDWNLIRTFMAVVEAGGLGRAARSLGLAHPTVARHVQNLEEALGVRLFERTAGGLVLNEAGERLAEVGRRMHSDALAFEAASEAVRTTPSGRVRISLAEVLVDLVPGLLAPLRDFSGEVERQFEILVSQDLHNLLEREADIAIRHVRPVQSELVCRRVGAVPMAAFASLAYVRQHGSPGPQDLDRHWFIDGVSHQRFSTAVERLGLHIPQARVAFRSDSLQTQRMAAAEGWGVAGLPVHLAAATPALVPVLEGRPVGLEVWVVARPGARQQQLLKMVADHLAEGLVARFGPSAAEPESTVDAGV